MNAEIIARALGGRNAGSGWMARCPAHDDRTPSLSLRDTKNGKVLVRCHAGCAQDEVIATLKASGLWALSGPRLTKIPHPITQGAERDQDASNRIEVALSIWQRAKPSNGTLVERYLRSRGLRLPATTALRFNAALRHTSGDCWPAMIALVTRGDDAAPLAIHRTFLALDGAGKASVEPQKMMLGPCRGGVVRLAEPGDVLLVGEGIETCLAAMQETGHAAWAALSTSGLRALHLPREIRDVIVLADGDDPGEAAARDCAMRWKRERRRVRIARPPKGLDFNDMLMSRVSFNEEGTQ
jgi:putative DNA primase/helicase